MSYITEPIEILTHFLRVSVDEITRVGVSNRHTNTTQSFNGNGATDIFTITTNYPTCINSVTVGGTLQTPYLHYDIDLDNKKIRFKPGYIPTVGTNNIVIDYDYGTNWIYPDKPRIELAKTSYPRIAVISLGENSSDAGMGETNTDEILTFQIDILAYKDQKCTIDNETKEGPDVCQYLARQVIKKIHESRALMQYKLYNPQILNNFPIPFQEDKNIFRQVIELKLEANNAGR